MSTSSRPIFHLPSFLFFDDSMSPTEYCQALVFLPDRVSPYSTEFHQWTGGPLFPNRISPRPDVARALHYGSIPDFDINLTDTRRPLAAIGTGRPPPDSPAPPAPPAPSMGNESAITNQFRNRLANAKLAKLQGSKFAKLFPPSALYGQPTFTEGVDQRIWNVRATYNFSPYRFQSNHGFARYGRPNRRVSKKVTFDLEAESDTQSTAEQKADFRAREREETMEEGLFLRRANANKKSSVHAKEVTFDPGAEFDTQSTAEQNTEFRVKARQMTMEEGLFLRRANANKRSSVHAKEVTFDPGAEFDTQSTAEQNTEFRARARQMAMEEGLALYREISGDESSIPNRRLHTSSWTTEQEAECRARIHQTTKEEILLSMREEVNEQIFRLDRTRHSLRRTIERGVRAHQTAVKEEVDRVISRLDLIRHTLGQLIQGKDKYEARIYEMTEEEEIDFIQEIGEEMSRLDCRYYTLDWIMDFDDEFI